MTSAAVLNLPHFVDRLNSNSRRSNSVPDLFSASGVAALASYWRAPRKPYETRNPFPAAVTRKGWSSFFESVSVAPEKTKSDQWFRNTRDHCVRISGTQAYLLAPKNPYLRYFASISYQKWKKLIVRYPNRFDNIENIYILEKAPLLNQAAKHSF